MSVEVESKYGSCFFSGKVFVDLYGGGEYCNAEIEELMGPYAPDDCDNKIQLTITDAEDNGVRIGMSKYMLRELYTVIQDHFAH